MNETYFQSGRLSFHGIPIPAVFAGSCLAISPRLIGRRTEGLEFLDDPFMASFRSRQRKSGHTKEFVQERAELEGEDNVEP